LGRRAFLWAVAIATILAGATSAQSQRTFLKGTVLSPAGRPVRSVWVIAAQNGRDTARSLTGDDGRYYIGNLAPGRYDVTVSNGRSALHKGQINLPANTNTTYNIRLR
jgi:protocatechuate 3,4-dioxygenase beta subunit